MKRRPPRLVSSFLAVLVAAVPTVAVAENWPAWRGPRHDGTSLETGLPSTWTQSQNVLWRTAMPGAGAATPIVWEEHIFLTAADGEDIVLLALDRAGKTRWKKIVGYENYDARQGEANAAAPSPTTDGKSIWVLLGTGELARYDFAGNQHWSYDLEDRYAKFDLFFGMSSSPLLDGDRLYLQLLHGKQQLVLALDADSGREIWRHDRQTNARQECLHSYASPVIYRHADQALLLVHGADHLTAHRLADGGEVWRCGGLNDLQNYNPSLRFVASPIVAEGLIVVPSAKNGPVLGLQPHNAQGDITAKAEHHAWRLGDNTPDVPSPVMHDGIVYLCRENGVLIALDADSGEILYQERTHSRPHRGSPIYADGKIFLMAADGTVSVVKAGRTFEMLAQNQIEERSAASLAVSDGTIYLRTYEALYAIGNKNSEAPTKAESKDG